MTGLWGWGTKYQMGWNGEREQGIPCLWSLLWGVGKPRPRKFDFLKVMQLIISGIWIHRQGTVLCSISSWNLQHELSWVISQGNCCIRAQDFSVSSRLWHLHTLRFSEHQQLTTDQFCLSCQETDVGCYRVVCMSPVRGLVRVVHPVNDAQLLPTALKAGTFCEWVGRADVSTISLKTLCTGILVLSSGTSFFGRCYSWKVI